MSDHVLALALMTVTAAIVAAAGYATATACGAALRTALGQAAGGFVTALVVGSEIYAALGLDHGEPSGTRVAMTVLAALLCVLAGIVAYIAGADRSRLERLQSAALTCCGAMTVVSVANAVLTRAH